MKKILPYLSVLVFFVSAVVVDWESEKWKKNQVLDYDIFGYHNYLPAIFIYKDITKYGFIDSIESKYQPTRGAVKRYGLYPTPKDSNLCNQYPMGVAIFQAPLFGVAHVWAKFTQKDEADGYSSPYQLAVVFSTLLFAVLSLILLVEFLKNYFSSTIIFFTVLLLAFATNFFHYATLGSGFAHIYQFFLYSAVLFLSHRWYKNPSYLISILMGLCIGLAIVTRPIDIFICLIPLLWAGTQQSKWHYVRLHIRYVYVIIGFAFFACLPQIFYWKFVTGSWVYFSYSEVDYFRFDRFRVIHGLFSYRKGWFVYTPLALFAFFQAYYISSASPYSFYRKVFWIFFIPMIYLVFSWNNWLYGWSFGCRALIGTLPLLAIPIALLLENIQKFHWFKKGLFLTSLIFFTFLNLFQTKQYQNGTLHGTLMNEAIYWRVFLKSNLPEDFNKNYKLQEELDWNTGGW
jgi:hypothetical protein